MKRSFPLVWRPIRKGHNSRSIFVPRGLYNLREQMLNLSVNFDINKYPFKYFHECEAEIDVYQIVERESFQN